MGKSLRKLQFKQFSQKMASMTPLRRFFQPPRGWIQFMRSGLNMSQRQLAQRLGFSQPAMALLEESEQKGSITLASLRKAAEALDCDLFYAMVPRQSLQHLVEKEALRAARKRLDAVHHSMQLEDQGLDPKALEFQIQSDAKELAENLDKSIWD